MIDLHSHLLPGLDDGPLTWEESLEMARAALNQGIRAVVATPHHGDGVHDNPAELVLETVDRMNRFYAQSRVPLTVLPGQEIRVYPGLLDDLEKGKLLPLGNSRYLLLELPDEWDKHSLLELFHELRLLNYKPVLAHPERYAPFIRNPSLLAEYVEAGALGQVTAHSLLGRYGSAIRRTALHMCRDGTIHLLSSDAHRPRTRGYEMDRAYRTLEREAGREYAEALAENSRRVLRGEDAGGARAPRRLRKAWFF